MNFKARKLILTACRVDAQDQVRIQGVQQLASDEQALVARITQEAGGQPIEASETCTAISVPEGTASQFACALRLLLAPRGVELLAAC